MMMVFLEMISLFFVYSVMLIIAIIINDGFDLGERAEAVLYICGIIAGTAGSRITQAMK